MIKTVFALLAVLGFLWAPLGRTAEPDSVAGKWHFVFDTPGGDREFDALFEVNADKVTGKWGISESDKNGAAVAGTYSEKKLALEFPANSEEVGPGTMKITGQLADDGTLSGDWSFQDYSGTFKATKVKEDAAK
jgi:hypothetical protein